MGKLIVLEGLDGSGKSTQLELLQERFSALGINFKTVSFPEYGLDSCMPVKMYLAGEFGTEPSDVNAYAASSFYAVDRFASYKKMWGGFYEKGGVILAGRYTTSNAVHQASKLSRDKWDAFLDWLEDYEYKKIGIPRPDLVIYLKVPVRNSQSLLTGRYSGDESKKDIHEKNVEYLNHCREAAEYTAQKWGWTVVDCVKDNKMRTKQDIADEIFETVKKYI